MNLTTNGGRTSLAKFTKPLNRFIWPLSIPFRAVKVVVMRVLFSGLISSDGLPLV
jgi:hypothetical protein